MAAMDMEKLLTAEQVAALVGKSKSQVNRDAAGERPRLATAYTVPGYKGARLFARSAVVVAYGLAVSADER